jgi:hypothetical protein
MERVWFLAWSRRLPGGSSLWLVMLCAGLAGFALALTGPEPGLVHERGRLERLAPFAALWAIAVYGAAVPLFVRSAQRAYERLRPHVRGSAAEIDTWSAALSQYQGRSYWVMSWLCIAVGISVQEINSSRWSRMVAGDWQAFDLLSGVLAMVALVVWPQSLFLLVHTARVLRRAVVHTWHPPLFDERCGRPLFRFGLNAVLLLTTGNVVVAVLLAPRAGEDSVTAGLSILMICVVNTVASIGILLFPTLVWRTKIRAMKADELAVVQRGVDGDREALRRSAMAHQIQDYDLLQLLAYRREVEELSDFPFTASHAGRLVLYLLLPPLSWVAAALAERVVDQVLG